MNKIYSQINQIDKYCSIYDIMFGYYDDQYIDMPTKKTIICNNKYDLFFSYIKEYHSEFYNFFFKIMTPSIIENHKQRIYDFISFIQNFSYYKGSFTYIKYVLGFYLEFYNYKNNTNRNLEINIVYNTDMSYILYSAIPDSEYNEIIKPITHPIGFYVDLVTSEDSVTNLVVYNINNIRIPNRYIDSGYIEYNTFETLDNTSITDDIILGTKNQLGYCVFTIDGIV